MTAILQGPPSEVCHAKADSSWLVASSPREIADSLQHVLANGRTSWPET
eukprot:CAMPEP_0170647112 /NCGR_PEP_ID=MMETSP0224-20130122/44014_1 /TAXON_ID=285029 /ORGANISM="Togula jolla, Strain CCCM 725" /LENGTH=48 /DNA_ID= /DNA_START= /DNA_END= /DNA_ORIENTATION=